MGTLDELREARAGLYFLAGPLGDQDTMVREIAERGAEALSSALEIIKALAEYHNAYVDWRLQGKWRDETSEAWMKWAAALARLEELGVEELIRHAKHRTCEALPVRAAAGS